MGSVISADEELSLAEQCDARGDHDGAINAFAESAYHWFFFARPAPFPETVIPTFQESHLAVTTAELRAFLTAPV